MHTPYRRGLLWMLTPYFLGAFVLVLIPVLLAGGMAFFRYDGLSPARCRLAELHQIFNEPLLKIALNNSLVLCCWQCRYACCWHSGWRCFTAARSCAITVPSFTCHCIPTALALAFLWIFNPLWSTERSARCAGAAHAWLAGAAASLPALVRWRSSPPAKAS
jgi:ABC-type sugar transport system permease subunit